MPSPSEVDERFQASSFIAFIGFLALFAQALHAIYKKRKKRQAKTDDPVALSAVTSDDGPQKPEKGPEAPGAQSPEPAETRLDDAVRKLLCDRKDAILSRARDLRPADTTPEVANVMCAYLFAADDLLKLNRARPGNRGGRGDWRTDAELNAAADVLVRETTDAVKLLQAKPDRKDNMPGTAKTIFVVGLLSMGAAMVA